MKRPREAMTLSFLRFLVLAALACLAGCAGRPGPEVLQAASGTQSVEGARIIKVYVATTRERLDTGTISFGNDRSLALNFAEFTISVPPSHVPGRIEWPSKRPDPKTSFITIEQRPLTRAAFQNEIVKRRATKARDVSLFVHGFNNNFPEALFRLVQISADAGDTSVPILFSWPSQASVTGYVADKDAVTFSRDGLADVLTMLAREKTIGRLNVLGHSMGAWLTAEALRQLRLTKQDAVLQRLNVVLAAPDIDVDVFRAQLSVIGPLQPPMTVLVSKDDRALAVSQLISGERQRLGALDVTDPRVQEAAKLANVQIVDISGVSADDGFKHNRFSSLAIMLPQISAQEASLGNIRRAGAFVFNTVGATLSSPFTLAGKVVSGP